MRSAAKAKEMMEVTPLFKTGGKAVYGTVKVMGDGTRWRLLLSNGAASCFPVAAKRN